MTKTPELDVPRTIRLARRRQYRLSQKELAARLGVRQSAVSQWECGRSEPDLRHRLALARELRIPLRELIRGYPTAPPPEDLVPPKVKALIPLITKLLFKAMEG